jgi:hypothetical protein
MAAMVHPVQAVINTSAIWKTLDFKAAAEMIVTAPVVRTMCRGDVEMPARLGDSVAYLPYRAMTRFPSLLSRPLFRSYFFAAICSAGCWALNRPSPQRATLQTFDIRITLPI